MYEFIERFALDLKSFYLHVKALFCCKIYELNNIKEIVIMSTDKIENELQYFITSTKDNYTLFELYNLLKHNEFEILKKFRDMLINGKDLYKEIYRELYLVSEKFLFDDFLLIKSFCEVEKQNKLPCIKEGCDNKELLLNQLFKALDYNVNVETVDFYEIKKLSNEYYDYILDFCSYIKDKRFYNNTLSLIEDNKLKISNEIVNKIRYYIDYNSTGYSPEASINWSILALSFNSKNKEALNIKKNYSFQQ